MKTSILIASSCLTVLSIWLGWPLLSGPPPIARLALTLPAVAVLVLAAGYLVCRSEKHQNSARGFWVPMLGAPLLAIIIFLTYRFAPEYFDLSVILVVHLYFIATGNYVTTSRTWISGFPTPWNVKSTALWAQSQRAFGWGMVIMALGSMSVSLAQGEMNEPVLAGGILALIVFGFAHSWLAFKQSAA
jgi:hypothetical protein